MPRQHAVPGSLLIAALCAPAAASTVVPMPLPRLADHAGQVIAGDVEAVRSYWATQPRRLVSEVTFTNVAYLKGALPASSDTFSLVVPGGVVGEVEMRVEGAPRFAPGESWVLFLLPEYKTFPVVGLSQGAFRLVADEDGVERVERGGLAVTGFDAGGLAVTAPEGGLTYGDLVEAIGPVLAASRPHDLAGPAGRPAPVRHTPAPLRPAGQGAGR